MKIVNKCGNRIRYEVTSSGQIDGSTFTETYAKGDLSAGSSWEESLTLKRGSAAGFRILTEVFDSGSGTAGKTFWFDQCTNETEWALTISHRQN
jgi:hypothetical protein